jgi:hypothetical protein
MGLQVRLLRNSIPILLSDLVKPGLSFALDSFPPDFLRPQITVPHENGISPSSTAQNFRRNLA